MRGKIALLIMLIILPLSSAEADQPGTGERHLRLDNEPAGPYLLRVTTSPIPPRVGDLNVQIRVFDSAGTPLTTPEVSVLAKPMESDGSPIEVQATHALSLIPAEYSVSLPISETGVWRITIRVESPLGIGEASFLERIARPNAVIPILAVGAPFGGLILLGILFLWLQRKAWKDRSPDGSSASTE